MKFFSSQQQKGFTLMETLIASAVFAVVAIAAYKAYGGLFDLVRASQAKIAGLNLANEQFEIARNLPYQDVGIVGGLPNGKIPHTQNLVRSNINFIVTATVRNVDLPFDGTIGGAPNDTSPADNKLVEVEVACPTCLNFQPIVLSTRVAPKNLETASTNGALFIRVFDANGQPIPQADVIVRNNSIITPITINDVTDNNGMLQLVDMPPGIEIYEVIVTKDGYSTDKTYAPSAGNPDPIKRHATVLVQQVTQISFIIDKLSTVDFTSVTASCTPVGNFQFSVVGGKIIGEVPDESQVHKTSLTLTTNASGNKTVSDIEWDSYTITGSDATYDLIGLNPMNQLSVNPDADLDSLLVVAPKASRGLLVAVKDTTALPLSNVKVTVTGPETHSKTTGQGFITQTDWSGGSGQAIATDSTQFFAQNGNVDTTHPVGEIKLNQVFGEYTTNAWLESSTFDAGALSNFQQIIWQPEDQPTATGNGNVAVQIATATTSSPVAWTFLGPDGTSGSYYDYSNAPLNSVHNNNRYLRYKMFLATASTTYTPNISDVTVTYTSSCTPPGQVFFGSLDAGTYTVTATKAGYATTTVSVPLDSSWKEQEITLPPL